MRVTIGELWHEVRPRARAAHVGAVRLDGVPGAPLNSEDARGNSVFVGEGTWADFARAVGLWGPFYSPRCSCGVCAGTPRG